MRILGRYATIEILKTFLFALLVFAGIFFIGSLYTLFREEFSLRQIAKALPYAIPYSLPFLVPIALLVGCTLGYGRLAADNEIVPISTSGVHLSAIVAPALLLGTVLTALIFGLESTFIPYWNFQQKNLLRTYIEQLLTSGEGKDKRVTHAGFTLYARRYHGLTLEGVEMVFPLQGGESDVLMSLPSGGEQKAGEQPCEIVAERASIAPDNVLQAIVLTIHDATVTMFEAPETKAGAAPPKRGTLAPRGFPRTSHVTEATILLPFAFRGNRFRLDFQSSRALLDMRARYESWLRAARSDRPLLEAPAAMAGMAGLFAAGGGAPGADALALARLAAASPSAATIEQAERQVRKIDETLCERVALGLAPLLFSLVGAAVPLLLRSNNRLVPFFAAFAVVCLTYFVPLILAQSLVGNDNLKIPAAAGFQAPITLTLAAGAALVWKVFRK